MGLAYNVGRIGSLSSTLSQNDYVLVALVSLPMWLLVFARYGLYASRRISGRLQEFRAIFHTIVVGVALLGDRGVRVDLNVSRRWVVLTFVFAVALVWLERELVRRCYVHLRRRGRFLRQVVVVGANEEGRAIAEMLELAPELGYRVVGFVDDLAGSNGIKVLGRTADTLAACEDHGATGVIVATTSLDIETSNRLVRELMDAGIHVELSSSLRDIASERLLVRPLGDFPVVYLEPVRNYGWPLTKRTFDILFAGGLLVLLAPVIVIVALRGEVRIRTARCSSASYASAGAARSSRSTSSARWSSAPSRSWTTCSRTTKRTARSSRCATTRA